MKNFAARMALATLLAALPALNAANAQGWPTRPIRMVMPAAPGAANEVFTRGLVEPLSKALGQPIVVDNRVGADGIIGMEACAKSPADGYTICGTASNVIIWNPVLRLKLPYDPLRDFAPVVHAAFFDSAWAVHPSVPANSVQELIALTQAKPDAITWASFGVNSTGFMYMEWFRRSRGARFYHVPYKTQPQALLALIAGEVQTSVSALAAMSGHVKAGKLKVLAVTGAKRVDFLPNVPTFEELGIKLPLRTWMGYHFPAGTPAPIVQRMNAEMRKAMTDANFRENIVARQMLTLNDGSPEEFDAYIRTQLKEVGELVKFLGLKAE